MHPGVAFIPDDTVEWGLPWVAPGLLLEVPRTGDRARRPSLHVEAAPGYRLRLMSGGQPLFWARIDGWWDRFGLLRSPAPLPWRLPAVSAAEVRKVTHASGTEPWWEAWMWRMGRALAHSAPSVLHAGRWCLRPLQVIRKGAACGYPISTMEWRVGQPPLPPHSPEGVLRFERFLLEDWALWGQPEEEQVRAGAVLPLRAPSSEDDGRVKSWRKHARAGTLPPVLLLYVDLFMKWLVLDGHDRLHAAVREGIEPPLLGLWPVREEVLPWSPAGHEGVLRSAEITLRAGATPSLVDRVNRMLRLNFAGLRRSTVTRAWPLMGGVDAWRAEVGAARRKTPFSVDPQAWAWYVSARS